MRLQRALARAGVASRRAAEKLIEDGRVRVDGKPATLGMKVDPERQRITVGNRAVKVRERRWLAFHKPLGVVTTAKDEEGRRTVLDFIPDPAALTYVGRLDVMTTGLLLLTTDGEAVHRLTHPRYRIPRRYTALVHGRPTAEIAAAGPRAYRDRRPGGCAERGQGAARDAGAEHPGSHPGGRAQQNRSPLVRGHGSQGGATGTAFLWPRPAGRSCRPAGIGH